MSERVNGRVSGKVALITGAARGQGRAHAVRLAAEGANVIVVDLCAPIRGVPYAPATPEDLQETVRLVENTGQQAISAIVDVRDLERLREIVDDAVIRLGRLDVVVANAAICSAAPWHEVTPESFEDTTGTNVTGVWNTVFG